MADQILTFVLKKKKRGANLLPTVDELFILSLAAGHFLLNFRGAFVTTIAKSRGLIPPTSVRSDQCFEFIDAVQDLEAPRWPPCKLTSAADLFQSEQFEF